jgi:hypothetical protein
MVFIRVHGRVISQSQFPFKPSLNRPCEGESRQSANNGVALARRLTGNPQNAFRSFDWTAAPQRDPRMNLHDTRNFKAVALSDESLRAEAPSIFAEGPMAGVSSRYTFVPTARLVDGLREQGWMAVNAEEQRIRNEARRGFQKHLIRFRRAEQMHTLDEWNVELVLLNSHDKGCAYQLHAGIYRRVCSNGLVLSEGSFEAIRFRHAGLVTEEVVQASFRLLDYVPKVGELVSRFRSRMLTEGESLALASQALILRYGKLDAAPVDAQTLLKARRVDDEGADLWTALNRVQENLIQGGVSDFHRDRRGKLRSIRAIRGIDSKIGLNKGLWGLAERLSNGESLDEPITLTV